MSASPAQLVADAATTAALLNCHIRETGRWELTDEQATLGELTVAVARRTATDRCRFAGPPRLAGRALGPAELAAHLSDELGGGSPDELLARVADSAAQIGWHLEERGGNGLYDGSPLSFIDSEQGLLVGHPLHPTAKSRTQLTADERLRYSPELQGRFRLHWLAVAPERVVHDSAVAAPATELVKQFAPGLDAGARVLVPAHPFQTRHADGDAIVDLGPFGAAVTPTSSLRTVYRADSDWQLKFSLDVRVTNSLRVTLPKELRRAVEAARLEYETPVHAAAQAAAPNLQIVHDPAYLAVRGADGELINGLSVLLRDNAFTRAAPICLASLCEVDPFGSLSRLGRIARDPIAWFTRYCDVVVRSLVRLYLDVGLCFEPHQQNTLLVLGADGLPERCLIRDSQGYFHREAAHADLTAIVPGLGEQSESIFPEALADERLVYYPFVNAAVGVLDTLVLDGRCDSAPLLAILRATLEDERKRGGRYPHTLLDRLLDDDRWPCKANLATRLHDLDELVGDIATQSVYVTIPNPLR